MIEFLKKTECINYSTENDCAFFQRDLNDRSSKIFLSATFEEIFKKLKSNKVSESHYYESWSSNQAMKLYIDYDNKTDSEVEHKKDIFNIITTTMELVPEITGVTILKSIPDTEKKSYHLIFQGIYFSNYKCVHGWVTQFLKPAFGGLFEKKVIDVKVYSPSCMRTVLSTKCGQNRPLYIIDTSAFIKDLGEVVMPKSDVTFEHFLEGCITFTKGCQFYSFKIQQQKNTNKQVHLNEKDIYTNKEIVIKYLDILDSERFSDRGKWLNVGYILYSIDPAYSDLWHYFSSKWENYNKYETSTAWDSFANGEYIYTINNLIYLAKTDNPEDYTEIANEIPNHDIKFLRPFDNILSKLIHRLYGERFVCSDCEHSIWYYFNGCRWKKENKNYNLRKLITDEVFNKIENYRRELVRENASESIVKNYHFILSKLGSGIKLNCLELEFYNSNFEKIIDQDKDLVGFENGVYDLKIFEFRKGRNSDYVSLSTGYDYTENTDPEKGHVTDLISQILPDVQVRNFTMKSLATCLDGHTRDENFYIWSGKRGSGANGKSTLCELLLKCLGDYGSIAPVSLFTGKRESANSANSALVGIRNKRCVFMQEPSSTDQIQVDVMKSLTGGDTISARELHASQVEFKPHAKFFMATNKLPGLSGHDGGTSRRLKITEFTSCFVESPRETLGGIKEFRIDKDLKTKLESYKPAFFSILLDYYKLYKAEGLVPPSAVAKVTKKFEQDNDVIKQFIDENVSSGKSSDYITKEELKELFLKDTTLKVHFKKFSNFLTQLENTLCTEIKLDSKRRVPKLFGFYIKGLGILDSDSEP